MAEEPIKLYCWSQGRLTFPNDRLLQSSVSRTPLGQETQLPKLQGRRNQTSKLNHTVIKSMGKDGKSKTRYRLFKFY